MIDEKSIAQFAAICRMLEDEEQYSPREAIGTYKEKQMHVALKRYATRDESRFEVKIGPYIADVCEKDRITEIQTGGFYPLRDKIAYYLNETEYHVTILHPVITKRTRVWLEPATGEVLSHYKSPRAERVQDALRELFWLSEYLMHPRLTVCLMLVEAEEIRLQDGKRSRDGKRGSHRQAMIPRGLLDEVVLSEREDYLRFLPDKLPPTFTAAEYGKAMGLRGKAVYSALAVLCAVGLVEKGERRGRAYTYQKIS